MEAQRKNPAPLAGGSRASETVEVGTLDGPKISPLHRSSQLQAFPAGFDPLACPIIWRHWYGASKEQFTAPNHTLRSAMSDSSQRALTEVARPARASGDG